MKKRICGAIGVTVILLTITAANLMQAVAQYTDSGEMFQTWEEFLESGVKIEYGETYIFTE